MGSLACSYRSHTLSLIIGGRDIDPCRAHHLPQDYVEAPDVSLSSTPGVLRHVTIWHVRRWYWEGKWSVGIIIKDSALTSQSRDHMICADSPGAFCQITSLVQALVVPLCDARISSGSHLGRSPPRPRPERQHRFCWSPVRQHQHEAKASDGTRSLVNGDLEIQRHTPTNRGQK